MSKVKLTEAELQALKWLPTNPNAYTRLGSTKDGWPARITIESCVMMGVARHVGPRSERRYAITDLGRAALAEHEAKL